jgi:hypothetical protein
MDRLHLFLPAPVLKALRALAKKRDISLAELIRRVLDDYLKEQK